MSIVFLSDSILTTIQDLGRFGFRSFGVNPGGAMDAKTVRILNSLLQNDEREAVIEMHFPAPKILFTKNSIIAVGGADFGAQIDGKAVQNWKPYLVNRGQTLIFKSKLSGNRAYLSVSGGFKIKNWLGSKSTNLKAENGGYQGRRILKNDEIVFNKSVGSEKSNFDYFVAESLTPKYTVAPQIRVIKGAEWDFLLQESRLNFLARDFTVSLNSDRMGFRLKSEPLFLQKKLEIVSSAVSFGTIQLLPDGQLIILMADHQTTGGYPRIAHICAEDLPLLAQLGANDSLRFEVISVAEAENLALAFEKNLRLLKTAVKFR